MAFAISSEPKEGNAIAEEARIIAVASVKCMTVNA
jgi:hypothetical protein